jgi:pyruvate,water dikinase
VNWTLPLRDAAPAGQAVAGGKAVRLAELLAQGFDVPPGFVVTTDAFVAHIMEAGASPLLDGEYPTPELLARVNNQPLNPDLARALRADFAALSRGDPQYVCAVRSSAADEDGTFASFAGQHATYYYTRNDDLETRIVDCWLSAFTLEARTYRRRMGLYGAPRMAVIVQYMVPADVSGVVFTRDPTGQYTDSLIVESCWGLGAALVDGRVSPDSYVLDRTDLALRERRIGSKRAKVAEALLDRTGARLEPVPRHLQRTPTLQTADVTRVAELAMRCEQAFGAAQDVEWAIKDSRLYLLQSRPVTRIATPPPQVKGRWIAFKPVLENSDEPFTPLSVDLFRSLLTPLARFIDGRLYIDFDAVAKWIPNAGDEQVLADALLLRAPGTALEVSWRQLPLLVVLGAISYLTAGVLFARTRRVPRVMFDAFRKRCEALLTNIEIDAQQTLRALLLPKRLFPPIGEQVLAANVSAVRYFFLTGFLTRYLARHAPGLSAEDAAALTSGPADMASRAMVEDIAQLAVVAAASPPVKALILANRFDELPHQLAVHPEAAPFVAELEAFMGRYGHRGTREIELAAPRWREDPTALFAMIANLLGDAPMRRSTAEQRRTAAAAALETHLPNRLRRALVHYVAGRIRYFAALRENTRHWHPLAFATVRAKILSLERQMMVTGELKCADDIFFLHWDEIQDLLQGRLAWRHVDDRVRVRRIRHLRRCRAKPPLAFNLDVEQTPPGQVRLLGRCASPGCVEGKARIIRDPAADGEIKLGDVLVAPYTDPSWTPLFLNASAVVVETGSYLSHAGTIARELGIPCVVDANGLLDTVEEGQLLRVDATAGTIMLLDSDTFSDTYSDNFSDNFSDTFGASEP